MVVSTVSYLRDLWNMFIQDLHAKMSAEAMACLSLGLPATVSHIIDENSPLANLSVQKMAARRMEVRILSLSAFTAFETLNHHT